MDDTPTDVTVNLVREAQKAMEGDFRAFEQLVELHTNQVLSNCRHLTRNPAVAEELAQDVFLKAYFGLRGFEGRSTFKHWLQRIKVNHCLNFLKGEAGRSHINIDDPTLAEEPELRVAPVADRSSENQSEQKLIVSILDSMSDNLRIPLIMCDMDELSYEEIATTLEISLSATKMRITRAREQFRGRYQQAIGTAGGKGI
jgi:RNA polymerase sigma-70 factor (ECF subfamily)